MVKVCVSNLNSFNSLKFDLNPCMDCQHQTCLSSYIVCLDLTYFQKKISLLKFKGKKVSLYLWHVHTHSTPLIETSYDLTLREAMTLLERFRSKSYDFNTQFRHVSGHFGT